MATGSTSQGKARGAGNGFEATLWFFTRISGILLMLMAAYNLVYANLLGGYGKMGAGAQMRWMLFPISFHVQSSEVEVTPNFANPFWQFYSFLFIAFAATHAANGLRIVLGDYVRHPLLLAWLKGLLFAVWLCVLLAALYLIFVAQG